MTNNGLNCETKAPRVGIIGALTSEMDTIKSSIDDPTVERISGIDFVSGTIHGVPVVAATSGMGKVYAAICTQTMILKYEPDLIINVGVAGSLCKELNIGDIAVANCVVQHDMDAGGLGGSAGFIFGLDLVEIPCCEETVKGLVRSAEALGFHTRTGVIASGDQFIMEREKKIALAEDFGGIACEMEGGGIGHVCRVNGIPFCILRAISDNGDESASGDFSMSLDMTADLATQVMDGFLRELADKAAE